MCLGIPGQVVEIVDGENALGIVDIGGVRREVNLACVLPEGDIVTLLDQWVLIHVGFAMSIIDEQEAEKTLELLRSLSEFSGEHLPEELSQ
jgi:hydrogenase expression/formation protein HypC